MTRHESHKIIGYFLLLAYWILLAAGCSKTYMGATPASETPVLIVCDPNEYAAMKARLKNINTTLRYVGIEDFEGREDEAVEWFCDMWGTLSDNWDTRSKDAVPIEVIWPDGCKTRMLFPKVPE